MTILAPSSKEELKSCMDYAIDIAKGPVAIRFPKDTADSSSQNKFNFKTPSTISYTGDDIVVISVGRMLGISKNVVDSLMECGYTSIHLLNMCTVKPINSDFYNNLISRSKITITIEDNIILGGAGQYILSQLSLKNRGKVINVGFDDIIVEQGTQQELFEQYGITTDEIVLKIKEGLKNNE